jgi:hypothetical protein
MPYVSPHGVVKATAPPRKRSSAESRSQLNGEEKMEESQNNVPSNDLAQEAYEGRDEDPEVKQEMEHWGGFKAQHHALPDECDYVLEDTMRPEDDLPTEEMGDRECRKKD